MGGVTGGLCASFSPGRCDSLTAFFNFDHILLCFAVRLVYPCRVVRSRNSQSMSKEFIRIGGAREHNLKNLTLEIPRDKLVVITGLSGSGKSSFPFETIYAEGQREDAECLSGYG